MWLDRDSVPRGEAREHSRVPIPRREGIAADDEPDAARHDAETLFHLERLVLALRLFPVRFLGHAPHLVPGVRDRFQRAILGVRAGGLEGHDERLPGRVHDRVRNLEALLVDAGDDLERDADPRFGTRLAPALLRLRDRREELIEIDLRISHAEQHAIRRDFATDRADCAGKL
jgi:hypothetical protein